MLSMRDAAFGPGEATSSRIAMTHVLPSRKGDPLGLRKPPHFELNPAPHMAPVYTSDPAYRDARKICPGLPAMALAG